MRHAVVAVFSLFLVACTEDEVSVDIAESAQQIGDVMASIDEAGGATGEYAMMEQAHKSYIAVNDRLLGSPLDGILELINPLKSATAAVCGAATFGACTAGVITRDFNDCTLGSATLSGTVTLTYSDAACRVDTTADTVSRVPEITVTGLRGATLTIEPESPGDSQVITSTNAAAGTFTFSNSGIRRSFSVGGAPILDFTTQTLIGIGITGNDRAGRVINGGSLRVTNNISGRVCTYSPSSVTWAAGCNCPTSGSWSGSCSNGSSTSLTINGCGSATLVVGDTTQNVAFDRCYATP